MQDSPDKLRKKEDNKKHPMSMPYPHPKHKSHHKEVLAPLHHPHTHPEEFDENLDHGTHEDNPRPAKINKKNLEWEK